MLIRRLFGGSDPTFQLTVVKRGGSKEEGCDKQLNHPPKREGVIWRWVGDVSPHYMLCIHRLLSMSLPEMGLV